MHKTCLSLAAMVFASFTASAVTSHAETLKPRMVVLTDVSTWETDDSESLVRLLVHADMLEIEGLVFTTVWSMDNTRDDFINLIHDATNAYEKLDASSSSDPDGDELTFKWWLLSAAGTYTQDVKISNSQSSVAEVEIPHGSAGKTLHLICEVTDDGTHALTSYRRIIFEPAD